jgi:thiamine biosynthesis lipoprotein
MAATPPNTGLPCGSRRYVSPPREDVVEEEGVMGTARSSPATTLPPHLRGEIVARCRFRAMNTDIEIVSPDWRLGTALARARARIAAFEARFSRFLPESELSRLNRSAGQPFPCSDEMTSALRRALSLHHATAGAFDPAVLPALEACGYDRSFELGLSTDAAAPALSVVRSHTFGEIELGAGWVRMPAGMRIDMGGFGKGYALERVCASFSAGASFLANAGGDIVARGDGPDSDGWPVAVSDPFDETREIGLLRLRDEAVATSSTQARRWRRGGRIFHHLIDPRTDAPSTSGTASVTVIAPAADTADVLAKVILLSGARDGCALAEAHAVPALIVTDRGEKIPAAGWDRRA